MVSVETIRQAAHLLDQKILRTQLVYSPSFSRMFGGEIYLKLENLQRTGSFKVRGAMYKLSKLFSKGDASGVVAASAGNHAQGVALAAREVGVEATIVMPEWASISKQEATRSYGGNVVLHGTSIGESLSHAQELASKGNIFIHPFDDPDIIAGQGTIGLEILDDLPNVDMIVVPVGGGGLISGIGCAVKSIRPQVQVIGVEAEVCPSATVALDKGRPVSVDSANSIADGIQVKQIGQIDHELIKRYVDQMVLVDEDQIAAAMLMLLERKKILAEGAGAVPLAALINEKLTVAQGKKVVLVISGGNVDSPLLGRILSKGLINNGRVMRVRVRLSDTPGSLAELLALVARLKANVLHIYHDRTAPDLPITISQVELELETRGWSHIMEINGSLRQAGYFMNSPSESP